jgi:hypothetical protein
VQGRQPLAHRIAKGHGIFRSRHSN